MPDPAGQVNCIIARQVGRDDLGPAVLDRYVDRAARYARLLVRRVP